MERADLLKDNGKIFIGQGKSIDAVAADDCRIAVVGNPCNTNCMIAAKQAKRLPKERFTAMVRLDQNRAMTQLAKKAGVPVTAIDKCIIYGNHSPTMFPDFANATINGKKVSDVISDMAWLKDTFIPTVGKRGAAIIAARGVSSAGSAANALIDHVKALHTPSNVLHSIAVYSDGSYGFDEGVWAGMPVRTTTVSTLAAPRPADIFDGRLRVQWPGRVTLPPAGALPLPLELDDPELRGDLSATRLSLGVLGATTAVESLVTAISLLVPGIEDTVRSVLLSVSDVSPSSDPAVCSDLSSG
jgi:hypothetical protein